MEVKGLWENSNEKKIFISGPNLNTWTEVSSPEVIVEGVVGSTFVFYASCSVDTQQMQSIDRQIWSYFWSWVS